MIRLKFDVLFQFPSPKDLIIYQLIPDKRSWNVSFDPNSNILMKEFLENLTVGISDLSVIENYPPCCYEIFKFLDHFKLLSKVDLNNHENPFIRQIEVFDSWNRTSGSPYEFQKHLEDSLVFIIGAGGIGSNLVHSLINCGIGRIHVADDDFIEIKNLARQSWYYKSDLGLPKVQILSNRMNDRGLGTVNPHQYRVTPDNIDLILDKNPDIRLFSGQSLPSEETGNVNKIVMEKILRRGIPYMCLGEHDAGPFLRNLQDLEDHIEFERQFSLHKVWEYGRELRGPLQQHPSYSPTIQKASAIATDEIVRFISGFAPLRTEKGRYSINPQTGEIILLNLKDKDTKCR